MKPLLSLRSCDTNWNRKTLAGPQTPSESLLADKMRNISKEPPQRRQGTARPNGESTMKVLLTGGKGMLGRTLCSELREYEMIPTDLPEADITDAAGFDAVCRAHHPDVVIH